ncbi:hypothetical protein [Sulfurimonas sp.]
MGKKEKLQKELDLLLEKIRFWRYALLAILSGIIGMVFAASQGKVVINFAISGFVFFGFIGILISVKRLSSIDKNYRELLDELEKVE